jgi:DNA-binding NarL/FixJ family response regulator
MIRLLIADDQDLVRVGLRMILEAQDDIEVIAEAGDGVEAIALAKEHEPDLVLMDIRMPRIDGLEATARLAQDMPALRIIILSTFDNDEYVYRALTAGASGFLLKSTPPTRLIDGVRLAVSGEALLAPSITRRMIEEWVRRPAPGAGPSPRLDPLTQRELEVLTQIGRGKSNAEISTALFLSESTVKTHINRILAKLGLRDRVQAVVFAYECGLVTPGART